VCVFVGLWLAGALSAWAAESGQPAPALAAEGLVWRWEGENRRFRVETEVVLPTYMWFLADQNRQARVAAWQVGAILDCDQAVPDGKKAWAIECGIVDVALRAAALPGDQAAPGRLSVLDPILAELDTKLTGARLQFSLRTDGRVTSVDVEGLQHTERRIGQMNENLRQVFARLIAGFDLELPKNGSAPSGVWSQRSSQLMAAPNQVGSLGGSETLHRVYHIVDPQVVIQSSGKGMIAPVSAALDAPQNLYESRVESVAVFDPSKGLLTERIWTVEGTPTASSAIAEGGAGVSYYQHGRLNWIRPGEPDPSLGASEEVASPGQTATALHLWQPLDVSTRP
jgi:hypothetical protein